MFKRCRICSHLMGIRGCTVSMFGRITSFNGIRGKHYPLLFAYRGKQIGTFIVEKVKLFVDL